MGWDPGAECPAITRLPVPDDIYDDLRNRLRRLATVVDSAHTAHQNNPVWVAEEEEVLKIFIVPEFYFRPPMLDYVAFTAYTHNVWNQYRAAIDGLFTDDSFRNWFFVCGTIVFAGDPDSYSSRNTTCNALVVKQGGPNRPPACIVQKSATSNIDGMTIYEMPELAGVDYKNSVPVWSSPINQPHRTLNICGVSIGMEVCLEHSKQVLRRLMVGRRVGTLDICLHLLIAGGMLVNDASVTTRRGKYILRNDGLYQPGREAVELFQVSDYQSTLLGVMTNKSRAVRGVALMCARTIPVPPGARLQLPPSVVNDVTYDQDILIYNSLDIR
ncbi:MAG: hypothetical protein LBH74_09475 [Nitrososphaerota archaeon]|jgi:hypothetical protein|nr:hypothetical protein [Nitrososphaerota archaeon]